MKFTPGIAIGAASGSIGGTTASRNRYGAYMRTRAIPIAVYSARAVLAKSALTDASQAWKNLTDNQRAAWRAWAAENPITNTLGQKQELAGNAAYVKLNSRLIQIGAAQIDAPPLSLPPTGITSLTLTADIGAGGTEIAYAASPVPASTVYQIRGTVLSSAGINYYRNLFRHLADLAAAETTPYDYQTAIEAAFGALVVGQRVVIQARAISTTTGLASGWVEDSAVVVTT